MDCKSAFPSPARRSFSNASNPKLLNSQSRPVGLGRLPQGWTWRSESAPPQIGVSSDRIGVRSVSDIDLHLFWFPSFLPLSLCQALLRIFPETIHRNKIGQPT